MTDKATLEVGGPLTPDALDALITAACISGLPVETIEPDRNLDGEATRAFYAEVLTPIIGAPTPQALVFTVWDEGDEIEGDASHILQACRAHGLTWRVVQPAYFIERYGEHQNGFVRVWSPAFDEGTRLCWILADGEPCLPIGDASTVDQEALGHAAFVALSVYHHEVPPLRWLDEGARPE
jgi:hypothetical protein